MKNKKTIEVFEAGKKPVHCKKCGNDFLTDKYPEICPFCKSRNLIFELPEDKKEVHVIIGIWGGCLDEVEVFTTDKDPTECEKKLCEKYDIPFDQKERGEYYDSDGEHEVKHMITEVH